MISIEVWKKNAKFNVDANTFGSEAKFYKLMEMATFVKAFKFILIEFYDLKDDQKNKLLIALDGYYKKLVSDVEALQAEQEAKRK